MADTMGHSPDRTASTIANSSATIAVLILALAPQLFELVYSIGMQLAAVFNLVRDTGRNPAQVVAAHGLALLTGPQSLAVILAHLPEWIWGLLVSSYKAPPLKATFSSDTLLAIIYSYPLFAVAILTWFAKLKAPQDYFGGIVLMALALFALWASSDLQGMRGFSFGAGTAPRMFGILMLGLGIAVMCVGLFTEGPHLATYYWRGPLFVALAILSFALTIRPMGLIFSAFTSFMVAALGSTETQWKQTIIVAICLTAFCSLLFPYALGLPLQMVPKFMIR